MSSKLELSTRGDAVVRLIMEHGIATSKLLQQALDITESQVKNELRKLYQRELVESFPFVGKQCYLRLTALACRALGASNRRSGKLGKQALRERYGVLHFLVDPQPHRFLLKNDELAKQLGELSGTPLTDAQASALRGRFYLDVDSRHLAENAESDASNKRQRPQIIVPHPIRLGHVFVDGEANINHLIRKMRSFLKKRQSIDAFYKIVSRDEFLFAVVTPTKTKADSLASAVLESKLGVSIRLHVCTELGLI